MRSQKTPFSVVVALATAFLVLGCVPPHTTNAGGGDGYFRASFNIVNSAGTTGVVCPMICEDPPCAIGAACHPVCGCAATDGLPIPGTGNDVSIFGTGYVLPNNLPLGYGTAALSELTVNFLSTIDSDDCQAKAQYAMANNVPLIIVGDGQVTYAGSVVVQATKVISCDLEVSTPPQQPPA